MLGRYASDGIEAFSGQGSTILNLVCSIHDTRESVGKVQAEETTDEVDEGEKVWDGGRKDEGEDPVDRTQCVPVDFAPLRAVWWELEKFSANLKVNRLETDVKVQDWQNQLALQSCVSKQR